MVKLTEEQKYFLKFMKKYLNYSEKQVQMHESMRKPDGQLHLLKSIKLWFNRLDETGDVKEIKKSGRPRLLNNENENKLIDIITKNPKNRFREIKRKAIKSKLISENVNIRTINNYSLRNGFKVRKAVKRNALNDETKSKRIKLAKKHLDINYSKDRIFVDEKTFQTTSSSKTVYVTRKKNEKFDTNKIHHCNTSSIHSKADVNIFAYIGPFGKGNLIA